MELANGSDNWLLDIQLIHKSIYGLSNFMQSHVLYVRISKLVYFLLLVSNSTGRIYLDEMIQCRNSALTTHLEASGHTPYTIPPIPRGAVN